MLTIKYFWSPLSFIVWAKNKNILIKISYVPKKKESLAGLEWVRVKLIT